MDTHTKRALLIGINYFGQDAELRGCHSDINDVATYLRGLGFADDNIAILLDDTTDPAHALPTSPTRKNILAEMRHLVKSAVRGDILVVHYSGHGSNVKDTSGDEKDGRDEAICPVDYASSGFIIDDEINKILVHGLPAGVRLRMVFDSCHSGSCADLPVRWMAGTQFADENRDVINRDIIMISGCADPQTSADAQFADKPNGALTWAYLKVLSDIKKTKRVDFSWKDICEMIRLRLRHEGFDQIPQLSMEKRSQARGVIDLI